MEKILIATDFSPAAGNAVSYGADLAKYFNAQIALVHSFTMALGGYDAMAPLLTLSELQNSGLGALREEKNRIISRIGYDPGIECICEPGSVFGVISEAATRKGIDLVVMGMVGQAGALKQKLIGSSALSAARNLQVPLLIVPEKAKYKTIRRISFAVDTPQLPNSTLLHTARAFTALFGAELELVEVLKDNEASKQYPEFVEKLLLKVKHVNVTLHEDRIAEALDAYYKMKKPDLVMVNPKKHNLFHDLFGSSVTNKLAFQLEIPLLAVH